MVKLRYPKGDLITTQEAIYSQIRIAAMAAGYSRGRYSLPEHEEAEGLLVKLLRKKPPHASVLRHINVSASVLCSRICSHELVRHGLASFTQESTRYVEGEDAGVIVPPGETASADALWALAAQKALSSYACSQSKREARRYMLPHCLATRLIITANLEEWHHIFQARMHRTAAPEIKDVVTQIHDQLREITTLCDY